MRLRLIRLSDFRNISFAEVDTGSPRVFLLGANGQGKTNLIEAAGLLPALRSFRGADTAALIRHGARRAQAVLELDHEREGELSVAITLERGRPKRVLVDGEPVRALGGYIGRFPAVAFCAADIELLRGAPSARRRWLDMAIAGEDAGTLAALRGYHAAREGRNRLLQALPADTAQLEAFERALAPHALAITRARRAALADLGAELARACAGIGLAEGEAGVEYRPDAEPDDVGGWEQLMRRQRERDAFMGATQRGPHRDDFVFRFEGRAARDTASEGQQRALVLGLGLAWLARARRRGVSPVVLADDILGELDPERKAGFWRTLGGSCQVLATGTQPPARADGGDWRVIEVRAGRYGPDAICRPD